jgi:hypothetical protein
MCARAMVIAPRSVVPKLGKSCCRRALDAGEFHRNILDGASAALTRRKARPAFNFSTIDESLLDEFAAFVAAGVERFRADHRLS